MIKNLFCAWEIKSLIALIASLAVSVFTNAHFIFLCVFVALVVIDLFTKQMSLSAKYIADTHNIELSEVDTASKIWGICLAFDAGYINSLLMRKKFLTKMATYFFAIVAAKLADIMIVNTPDSFLLNLVYSYLGATEFISILENLRDGGNTTIGRFVDFVNAKVMSKLK